MGGIVRAGTGARPPSHVAYYVALCGVLALLLLLCCYFFYFCFTRVTELSRTDTPGVCHRPPPPTPYPVLPEVRESASAMARLCRAPPAPPTKSDAVFPAPLAVAPQLSSINTISTDTLTR